MTGGHFILEIEVPYVFFFILTHKGTTLHFLANLTVLQPLGETLHMFASYTVNYSEACALREILESEDK